MRSASLARAIQGLRVIVFEHAHHLTTAGSWRDERLGSILGALVDVAQQANIKLVLETQRELPLELPDPTVRQRLRVTGLQKHLRHFGQSLFDAQLRRVGLSPDVVSDDKKGAIVERLGGHPIAIALAADASYDEGGDAVFIDRPKNP